MSTVAPLRLRFGPFEFDEADARLAAAGRPVALAPRAFDVLAVLLRHAGQLVTKDALLDAVWGHRHVSESVLKTTVSELGETATPKSGGAVTTSVAVAVWVSEPLVPRMVSG